MKKQSRKLRKFVSLVLCLAVVVCAGCTLRSADDSEWKDTSDSTEDRETESDTAKPSDTSESSDSSSGSVDSDTASDTQDIPFSTDPPVSETDEPIKTDHPGETLVRVPESEPVDDEYFRNAVFIGDSRTVGLYLYSGLKSNYYSEQGLNVSSVMSKEFIAEGESKLTLADALETHSFRSVYISFGINEIGWNSTQSFIDTYQKLIELVESKQPDADIYVQSILPMSKEASESELYSAMGGNAKVAEYNERLYALCESMGHYFIDLDEIFADENGNLNISDTTDGIHLGVASCTAWVDYLRNHAVS